MKEMRKMMMSLFEQNRIFMEQVAVAKIREVVTPASSAKVVYMKNVPKPMVWDTKDRKNIETFITKYETYREYVDDNV